MGGAPEVLAEYLETLAEHLGVVAEHLEVLADGLGTVAEHLGTLAERPEVLAEGPKVVFGLACLLLGPMSKIPGLRVYKFGGASVKDAAAILNLCRIVRETDNGGPLLVVVSAMGKTTNALEEIYDLAHNGKEHREQVVALLDYHEQTFEKLNTALDLSRLDKKIFDPFFDIDCGVAMIIHYLDPQPDMGYDERYDQIISKGEELSADLVVAALAAENGKGAVQREWAWRTVRTDNTWREGRIDWEATRKLTHERIGGLFVEGARIVVIEGFIGGTADGRHTTLGREGSDYSAAIFAYCLNAESVTIWKDVAGLLNADPKLFPNTVRYSEISYRETIEMAYYGASVIHPKTIKPLAERGIPLYVKSFLDPGAPGTVIHDCQHPALAPAFIRKTDQCLISFESKDFTFISEENLAVIFGALAQARLKINLMQNSAISFSVCTDFSERRVAYLLDLLREHFRIHYNAGLVLFTIKNYDAASIKQLTEGKRLLLEQRTRGTFQFVCAA